MQSYPESLPPWIAVGLTLRQQARFARTEMESGPARQRRRTTYTPTTCSVETELTADQLSVFDAWWHHKIEDGTDWFQSRFERGRGLELVEMRFTDEPEKRRLETTDQVWWRVAGSVEIRALPVITEAELDAKKFASLAADARAAAAAGASLKVGGGLAASARSEADASASLKTQAGLGAAAQVRASVQAALEVPVIPLTSVEATMASTYTATNPTDLMPRDEFEAMLAAALGGTAPENIAPALRDDYSVHMRTALPEIPDDNDVVTRRAMYVLLVPAGLGS